jgi:hypothetical protein
MLGDHEAGEGLAGSRAVVAVEDLVIRGATKATELGRGVALALATEACMLGVAATTAEVGRL